MDLHFFLFLRAWFNKKTNCFSAACFMLQTMQDALRHMENIYSEMLGISEFVHMIYNRYLQLELLKLREEMRMTDMLNNKMYFKRIQKWQLLTYLIFLHVVHGNLSMKS